MVVRRLLQATVLSILFLTGCSPATPVTDAPQYEGLSLATMLADEGPPVEQSEFFAPNAAGEMRVEIWNHYPPEDPASKHVLIKERWWDRGDAYLTVWFHEIDGEWVALDTLLWDKDIQF